MSRHPLAFVSPTLTALIIFSLAGSVRAGEAQTEFERVEVFPSTVDLGSARAQMQLVVVGHTNGEIRDLSSAARIRSGDSSVAKIDATVVRPIADGTTKIHIDVADRSVVVPVTVAGFDAADPVSFRHEALAILTKQGCNSGNCHGSARGKGGFRISLLAANPELDEITLTREVFASRTNVLNPGSSLLLKKPTMAVSHGGGVRLVKGDPTYALLRDWIGEGCIGDLASTPECVKLEVFPSTGVLRLPKSRQQLLVLAHFSDGSVRDVTTLAKFSSSDDKIATANPEGQVRGHTRGDVAILVRYAQDVTSVTLTLVENVEGLTWNEPAATNYVDQLVNVKLKQMAYPPSPLTSDAEFLRRVSLDVLGVLPSPGETREFLESTAGDKRAQWIDRLLSHPQHARFWALKWGDVLNVRESSVTGKGVHKYYEWIVRSVAENQPFDEFCRELLLATGSTYSNPAANFYRTKKDANECVETTAQLFLGLRIQCAKCHNHPFEAWTQKDYYGLAAFFTRVQRKEGSRKGELVVWVDRTGEVQLPGTDDDVEPALPFGDSGTTTAHGDRRQPLAQWLTAPNNPLFARVAVNRIWSHVMGRGIVEPIDDFRPSNPPSNEELLAALAGDFINSGFDRRRILRVILNSRTYQRSAASTPDNAADTRYFSHAAVRRLTAEQLLDAVCHVTGRDEKFPGLPAGTRATALPSPDANNEFLRLFGQPQRETVCSCERVSDSNVLQALELFNGDFVHRQLSHPENRFQQMITTERPDAEILEQLYLAALCRPPREDELKIALSHLHKSANRITGFRDVCWALLNTREFLFQH